MKIILGTASFNQNYGSKKFNKKNSDIDLKKIVQFCRKKKIYYLDTAVDYSCENVIKKFFHEKKIIITKLPNKIPQKNSYHYLKKVFTKYLKKLNVKKVYGVLIHDPNWYKKKNKLDIVKFLRFLKKKNFTKKIGVSIYTEDDYYKSVKFFKPSLVQIPINIFDQRLVKSNFLKRLKSRNVEIHARSIYLKGIIFNKNLLKKPFFSKLEHKVKLLRSFSSLKGLHLKELTLLYVARIKEIDRIIIGIRKYDHLISLEKTLKKIKKIKIEDMEKFSIKEKKVLDPRKWKYE